MTHTHEWRLGEWLWRPTIEEMNNIFAVCIVEDCDARLEREQIEVAVNACAGITLGEIAPMRIKTFGTVTLTPNGIMIEGWEVECDPDAIDKIHTAPEANDDAHFALFEEKG